MINRVMRLNRNPNARGFVVRVLEETDRDDALGMINFKCVARSEHGTKKAAERAYDELRAKWSAR